jgi:hypothetical protein
VGVSCFGTNSQQAKLQRFVSSELQFVCLRKLFPSLPDPMFLFFPLSGESLCGFFFCGGREWFFVCFVVYIGYSAPHPRPWATSTPLLKAIDVIFFFLYSAP